MTTTSAIRTIGGTQLPAPGVWTVDPSHAEVGFVGRHLMLTKVRGRFTGLDAIVTIGEQPEDSTIEATIDMTSVSTGDQSRDDHLRSPDFFDVDNWRTAAYRSTNITWSGREGTMTGDLTIKGVAHPLTLEVEYLGYVRDPWDNDRVIFDATGSINREDWGLSWNMVLETGGLLVSKEITLELHVELIRNQ